MKKTTEQKLSAIVVDTLVKLGIEYGHDGLRDALKDAVFNIHVTMKQHRCDPKMCFTCNRADCPLEECYHKAG